MRLFLPFVFGQKRPIGLALAWEEAVHVRRVTMFRIFLRSNGSVNACMAKKDGMAGRLGY